MVIVDTNVLIYAFHDIFPQHETARTWLLSALGGRETIAFPALSIIAYVRLTTAGKVVAALTTQQACADIDECLTSPAAIVIGDGPTTWPFFQRQLTLHRVRGNLTNDAYLAALALEHGATVATFDRDFARFSNVRVAYVG